ncbi:MAG: ArsR/SmtB family transcription factor [Luteimonas sp.]
MNASNDPRIETIAATYRLLGDPTRLRVLLACLDGPIAVGDIAARIGASQPLVSHHLRLLRGARLVRGERHQRRVLYATADAHISHMLADMLEHADEPH